MPGSASQRRNVHPLSRTSRRRRRLASPGELPETIALADAPDAAFPRPAHCPTPLPEQQQTNTAPSRWSGLLTSAEPRVWLFAGDTPGADSALVGAFASQIRIQLNRAAEIVVDAAYPGCTIADVRQQLRHRILPRQPDAVVLTVLPGDCVAPDGTTDEFEEHLAWVLETLQAHEIAVLVVTAAGNDQTGNLPVAAIHAVTAEQGSLHVAFHGPDLRPEDIAAQLVSAIMAGQRELP